MRRRGTYLLLIVLVGGIVLGVATQRGMPQPRPSAESAPEVSDTALPDPDPPLEGPRFYLFPEPSATPPDRSTEEALEILRRSDEAMNALRSLSMRAEDRPLEDRTAPPSAVREYRFVAPDRLASSDQWAGPKGSGSLDSVDEMVVIGHEYWYRSGGGPWVYQPTRSQPYAWPRFNRYVRETREMNSPVQDVVVEREEEFEGHRTWVVTYWQRRMSIEGPFDEFTTEWIDSATYRLLASEHHDTDPWASRALVVERYTDFDEPLVIEPPADADQPGDAAPSALP